MGTGGAFVAGGVWISVFSDALLRIGDLGETIHSAQWPALGFGAVLVLVGAALGRRALRHRKGP